MKLILAASCLVLVASVPQQIKRSIKVVPGLGLLEPLPDQEYNEESERYFKELKKKRAQVPSSYSARSQGLVSPVKSTGYCDSCAAFAAMAAVETCFRKITGVLGDNSEQQMIDCGYGYEGAEACKGARLHSYTKWAGDTMLTPAHESHYPYLWKNPNLYCPADLPVFNQGAKVSGSYYTYDGDEEMLKQLVYEHGAVLSAMQAGGPFQDEYDGGIFDGCPEGDSVDHAVTVVGYGTENGVDFWEVKNSWGKRWGDDGFFRIKRGVNMCNIGMHLAVVHCTSTPGPTDPTPPLPCIDLWDTCHTNADSCDIPSVAESCPKTCNLC